MAVGGDSCGGAALAMAVGAVNSFASKGGIQNRKVCLLNIRYLYVHTYNVNAIVFDIVFSTPWGA